VRVCLVLKGLLLLPIVDSNYREMKMWLLLTNYIENVLLFISKQVHAHRNVYRT
jgi:hypothetical protein